HAPLLGPHRVGAGRAARRGPPEAPRLAAEERRGAGAVKVALVNPPWSFHGSVYFGCHEPHLPLEYGYATACLGRRGHEARLFDAQARGLSLAALRAEVEAFAPDALVVTTAPSYLFWRCAPPELRVPQETLAALRGL